MTFEQMVLRTAITFFALLLLTRILGKKQMSQMTYFNYITGIAFGSISASFMTNPNIDFKIGISSIAFWAVLTLLVSFVSLKSMKMRIIFDGEPRVIIKNGKVLDKAMRKERLDVQQLTMMLRKKNIFSLKNVDYAVMEPNGEISVLQKVQYLPATKQDVRADTSPTAFFPTQVIVDGKIIEENLQGLNLNKNWLTQQLKQNGVNSPMEVFLAEVDEGGNLYIDKYYDSPILH